MIMEEIYVFQWRRKMSILQKNIIEITKKYENIEELKH